MQSKRTGSTPHRKSFLSGLSPFSYSPKLQPQSLEPSADIVEPVDTNDSFSSYVPNLRNIIRKHFEMKNFKSSVFFAELLADLSSSLEDQLLLCEGYYQLKEYHRCLSRLKYLLKTKNLKVVSMAGSCCMEMCDWEQALGYFDSIESINEITDPNISARIYCMKGTCYLNIDNIPSAVDCFKKSLLLDVTNVEAFQILMQHHLLTKEEEKDLLNQLSFNSGISNDLIKPLYQIQLKKYGNEFEPTIEYLSNVFPSACVLLEKAKLLSVRQDYEVCYHITSKLLKRDAFSLDVLPVHVSTLYALGKKSDLFKLSHELVSRYPNNCVTWYCVALYYMCTKMFDEARKYFAKSTCINPLFAEGWLGFGHSFAIDGEHDQAISAYSTAIRLFRGCHLPLLYIGMEHSLTNNPTLALQYLKEALKICPEDPCVFNEIACLHFKAGEFSKSLSMLLQAKTLACNQSSVIFESINVNLGHTYRRLEQYESAQECFYLALSVSPFNASTLCSIGMVLHTIGKTSEAVEFYHKALRYKPDDVIANELLAKAVESHLPPGLEPSLSPWVNSVRGMEFQMDAEF